MIKIRTFFVYYIMSVMVLLTFLPTIIQAQELNFNRWKQLTAEKNQYYQDFNKNLKAQSEKIRLANEKAFEMQKAKAVDTNAANFESPFTGDKNEAQCQADPACKDLPGIGVIAQEDAVNGDTIPIFVIARNAQKITKVNLMISDPKTNQDFFKDTYTNIKKQDSFYFSYSWDTLVAETNADTASSVHTVTAEYVFENGKTINATRKIKINAFTGFDVKQNIFWGGYLRNDGSYSAEWKTKLGCASTASLCSDMTTTKTALESSIAEGRITETDVIYLNDTFSRYITQITKNPISGSDEEKMQQVADYFNMSDIVGMADEQMDIKMGVPAYDVSEDFMKSPENLTTLKIIDKYSAKIASYDPQSVEEMKAMPIWPTIEAEIKNNINKDKWNIINSLDEIAPPGSATDVQGDVAPITTGKAWINPNSFALFMGVKTAQATDVVGAVIDVGFLGYDIYQLCKKPSWGQALWVVADVGFLAWDVVAGGGGEAHLALGAGRFGAKIMAHLPVLGRIANKAKDLYEVVKGSKAVTKTLEAVAGIKTAIEGGKEAIGKYLLKHPNLAKMLDKINPTKSGTWALMGGALKKVWGVTKAAGKWIGRNLGAVANTIAHLFKGAKGKNCEQWCPVGDWKNLWNIANPISNMVCQLQCVVLAWMIDIINYIFDNILVKTLL